VTRTSYSDAYLWKMSAEGTTLWVVRSTGTGKEALGRVVVDGAVGVVAAGVSQSSATFGGVALTSAGGFDAVIWKLSGEGTTLWAVRGGGTDDDHLDGVAVDGTGGLVAAGRFSSSPATFGGVSLSTAGSEDAMVWKVSGVFGSITYQTMFCSTLPPTHSFTIAKNV